MASSTFLFGVSLSAAVLSKRAGGWTRAEAPRMEALGS